MDTITKTVSPRFASLLLVLAVMASLLGAVAQPSSALAASSTPMEYATYINILEVKKGESVMIQVAYMSAYREYRVLMNTIGTKGENGTEAGKGKTDSQGRFKGTFPIPASLKNSTYIAIRIEATDSSGSYAYNWFVNNTSGTSGSTSSSTGSSSADSSYPNTSGYITVTDVQEDKSVTFSAKNLPANRRMSIYLDWRNAYGFVKGVNVGSSYSSSSGTLTMTVKMPALLVDRHNLAIRLQAFSGLPTFTTSVQFLNATSDNGTWSTSPTSSGQGLISIKVTEVKKGKSVTINISNLPLKKDFVVLMGKMGTNGVGGIEVGSVSTKTDKILTGTFDIPKNLQNRDEIAIRIEAEDGSYYFAYTWFENKDLP